MANKSSASLVAWAMERAGAKNTSPQARVRRPGVSLAWEAVGRISAGKQHPNKSEA